MTQEQEVNRRKMWHAADTAGSRDVPPATHFVGFRGEEYLSAVRAFGPPDFIHRGWDKRAQREIADGDLVVFATGSANQEPRAKSFDDIREPDPQKQGDRR